MLPPAPALVARFRTDLASLGEVRGPLGIAYSGGPDSLALLLLAAAAFPGMVHAATVDHCLREDSASEAALAAQSCRVLGVPHSTLPVSVASGASVQAQAREARYAALGDWMVTEGVSALLTAHHLDDQAETLLMRLMRGAGVGGLAGIRARRPLGNGRAEILRPMLGWRRAELAGVAAESGLAVADDSSNRDEAFDRVHVRRMLSNTPWLEPVPLARSAGALAEAEEALQFAAQGWFAAAVEEANGSLLLRSTGLPAELLRRLLLACLRHYSPDANPRGPQLSFILDALRTGGTTTLAGVKFAAAPDGWRVSPAPPRRLAPAKKQP